MAHPSISHSPQRIAGELPADPPVVFWQGFRHSWTYNHRLNRLGDWIDHHQRSGDHVEATAAHSAASGSGADVAQYTNYRSTVRARGVIFTEVKQTIQISSREQVTQVFAREIRIPSRLVPQSGAVLAACINGFDLLSEKDADKLVSFHVAVSRPHFDPSGHEIVCHLLGALNVDCDSPECDQYGGPAELLAATVVGADLGWWIGGPVGAGAGALFGALFSKLNLTTDYTLVVRLIISEGESDSLAATRSIQTNEFAWDKKTAIHRADLGTLEAWIDGDGGEQWTACVPTISQLSLVVTRERGILTPDTAMHFLEWDMAVRPIEATPTKCRAEFDLFFRNWRTFDSKHLDDKIDIPLLSSIEPLDELMENIASHHDAGTAKLTLGIELLQFAEASAPIVEEGSCKIKWPGENLSADSPDAIKRKEFAHDIAAPVKHVEPSTTACMIILEHMLAS